LTLAESTAQPKRPDRSRQVQMSPAIAIRRHHLRRWRGHDDFRLILV
jgi:hypothetical protein